MGLKLDVSSKDYRKVLEDDDKRKIPRLSKFKTITLKGGII